MPFSHTLATRSYSDSVIVKLTADTGETGFGEGIPRPYVTGETVSSCLDHIRRVLLPVIERHNPGVFSMTSDPPTLLSGISGMLPDGRGNSVIAFNAARAAVEIALLDTLLRSRGVSLGSLIPPVKDSVTYSAVITADSVENARKTALICGGHGISQVKVKVGSGNDRDRIAAVRDVLGGSVSLRVDANGAFDVKGALALIESIQTFQIDCIEQPVPRGNVDVLSEVRRNSSIPIMTDESLITKQDAADLIEKDACDLFNLRISKNGGVFRTLRLAEMAREAGVGFQLGCQVGETAILSAAGRHVAAHLSDVKFVEGSYGAHLLEQDIADDAVEFGYAGRAPLLAGEGLGIRVREDLLKKYSEVTIAVEMA